MGAKILAMTIVMICDRRKDDDGDPYEQLEWWWGGWWLQANRSPL